MYLQPFSSTSIWNRPIGSGANFAKLTDLAAAKGKTWHTPWQGYSVDESYIVLDPTTPDTAQLVERSYWWPYPNAAAEAAQPTVATGKYVRVPNAYTIPIPPAGNTPNNMCAMLKSTDSSIALECQYVVRPNAGDPISFNHIFRGEWNLRGEGINDSFGSHGGAGMCCIGGTIRANELVNADPIPHALAVTINTQKWACTQGGGITNGFRWPAQAADSNALQPGGYGTNVYYNTSNQTSTPLSNPGVPLDGLGMGTLLGLPTTLNLDTLGFETSAGRKIATALKNYGAYVVDTSLDTGSWDTWLWNLDKVACRTDLPALSDSYAGGSPGMNTALTRDLNKVILNLAIVTNNAAGGTCSGGGTPIVAVAPPLA